MPCPLSLCEREINGRLRQRLGGSAGESKMEENDTMKAAERLAVIRPFLLTGISWYKMLKRFGSDRAYDLAQEYNGLARNDIFEKLRSEQNLTLDDIGDLYGVTRERVRQLTEVDGYQKGRAQAAREKHAKEEYQRTLQAALHRAISTPDAWGKVGLNAKWVIEKFGLIVHKPHEFSKLEVILKLGMGLETRADMIEWAQKRHIKEGYSYAALAKELSERFVPISTMGVYNGLRKLGFRGRLRGRTPLMTAR